MLGLGLFDLITGGVAALGYGIGRKRGLVWQLCGVATLVLGGVCATILCNPLGPLITDGLLGRFAAWIVVYAAVAACLYLLCLRLKHRLDDQDLGELDERFGGMLGAIKALIVFGVVTLIAIGIFDRLATTVRASASGRALHTLVAELEPYLPQQFNDALLPRKEEQGPAAKEPGPVAKEPEPARPARPPRPSPEQGASGVEPFERVDSPEPPPPAHPPQPEPELEPQEPEAEDHDEPTHEEPPPARPDPFDPHAEPTDPLAPPR